MINELAKEIHANNVAKGFYEDKKNIGEMLALIHSEVSEALEADRKGRICDLSGDELNFLNEAEEYAFKSDFEYEVKDSFSDEIADVIIRCLDLAAYKGIDIENHIKAKMRYNTLREYKHGKNY